MDQVSLVIGEVEAGWKLAQAFHDYLPVKAAFWLKEGDASQKYFYLASDKIDGRNFDLAYGEVLRLNSQMPSIYLNPMQTKVINANSPFGQAAQQLNAQFPSPLGTRLGGCIFGGIYIEYAYIPPGRSRRGEADYRRRSSEDELGID